MNEYILQHIITLRQSSYIMSRIISILKYNYGDQSKQKIKLIYLCLTNNNKI